MEGHCHPVVNTGKATDHSGATKEELAYTGPGSSCVPTHTNTHVMTLTVYLTAACLQVAAANLQLPTSIINQPAAAPALRCTNAQRLIGNGEDGEVVHHGLQ